MIGGAPGTGKSTVAQGLADRKGWVLLRSDVVRKELSGLDPRTLAAAPFGTRLYSDETTRRTYDELLARARLALEHGESVVVDASWADADRRDDAAVLAATTSSDLLELRCDVDAAVADERLRMRQRAGRDPSDADPLVAAAIRDRAAPWPTATVVDTSGSRDAALELAVAAAAADPLMSG
jgi:predicted kinase